MKFFLISLFCCFLAWGNTVKAQSLDHTRFLELIKNSSDTIYRSSVREYDKYLATHPWDVKIMIEKCKFIELAQYDADEEYNPNQDEFDSCTAELSRKFPVNPDVMIFKSTYLWGDEQKALLREAEEAIRNHPLDWNASQRAEIFRTISDNYYWDSDFTHAYEYILKVTKADPSFPVSVETARILIKQNKKEEALNVLLSVKDTTENLSDLNTKAELYLELKEYSHALKIYHRIDEIDSSFNNKTSLASTLEGVGEYSQARAYLVKDTIENWDKTGARLRLFIHDLRYEQADTSLSSYNLYRDTGFSSDPLGLFRIKLFFSHPFLSWRFRDFPALFLLLLSLVLLLIIPYIWILPVYFAGQRWKLRYREKEYTSDWNLKYFWFVSAGYLITSFLAYASEPEYLYSLFNSTYYELAQPALGKITLLYILFSFIVGLLSLYKISPSVLIGFNWSIARIVYLSIVAFLLYKVVSALYITIGTSHFGVEVEDLTVQKCIFLVARQDIRALLATYGNLTAIVLICIVVPFYEEILFRGVILDSCQKYLNFNLGNIIQSVLFASVHMSLFLFPVYFVFGMTNGVLRKKSGGLLGGILFHIINNLLALGLLIARVKAGH